MTSPTLGRRAFGLGAGIIVSTCLHTFLDFNGSTSFFIGVGCYLLLVYVRPRALHDEISMRVGFAAGKRGLEFKVPWWADQVCYSSAYIYGRLEYKKVS